MFALVRKPLFRKAVILLFVLPLMFAGGSLVGGLAQETVGSVESFEISRYEYENVYRNLLEEYRRRYGVSEVSPELNALIARDARNQLVTDYLMRAAVEDKSIAAPPAAVAREIREYEEFQNDDGEFSFEIYSDYVPDRFRFEAQIRRSLGRETVFDMMESFPVAPVRERLAAFRRQHRIVDEAHITVTASFNIPEDDIRAYYEAQQSEYLERERASYAFVTLSFDAFARERVTVSEEEVETAYEDFAAELGERRRLKLSHIYIADDSEEGYARAEELAQRAAEGGDFAALAAEHSDDAGSAAGGGSLGFFAAGDLPEEMELAAEELEEGGVSEPVEVDGGFSVLRLDEIVTPPIPPLAQVRERMETAARRELAYDEFQNEVERLKEIAYRQVGSLVSLATLAQAEIHLASVVYRRPAPGARDEAPPPPFAARAVREETFAESIVEKGETGAIALEDDNFMFVRALAYQPRRIRPLAEVREEIAAILNAGEQAKDLLAAAEEGESLRLPEDMEWGDAYTLSLTADDDDEESAPQSKAERERLADLDDVFNADLSGGLPAFAMIPEQDRIRVFRIRDVVNNAPLDEDYLVIDELTGPAERSLAGAGYLDVLSDRYKVRFDLPDAEN